MSAETHQTIGPYALTSRLGQGGIGDLYIGRLEADELSSKLAIKVISEAYCNNPEYVRAFRRESETAARIEHPNVVQVLDHGEDDGRQYLVMELLHGRDLSELFQKCRANGTWIPVEIALWILARVAEGLQSVHEACDDDGSPLGMVHGDVSPQNIFLTREGEVKLIDFGLARSALRTTDDNSPAKVYGKVHYVSPEQAKGRIPDRRSDIFSIGATLYEALCGHSAFSAASKFLVLLRISQGSSDPIRDHMDDLSPALERIVNRALAHDPRDRFESAESLRLALEGHLSHIDAEITEETLSRFLEETFGDAVDAAAMSPTERRRTTRTSITRPAQSGTGALARLLARGDRTPGWAYLLVGITIGLVAGAAWVLHTLGVF